ncbi:RNA polymerase-associated protein [Termitomyces sp. J132]|nr:RNA polymerase-associated protein [Termitomyces sp. J132]
MSDLELEDELLALAGVDKKRKRSQGSSKASSFKKRKADMSDSEGEGPESEEGEEDESYPLEGKFIDEADRLRLMQMNEIERENIIASRLEEKQRKHDQRIISQMYNQQQRGADADAVSKAAKRQHTARGATKEKSRKLDELKAKRKAKDEKQRVCECPLIYSVQKDLRNETALCRLWIWRSLSDDESEDGQISKYEQEEEKERKMFSKPVFPDDQPAAIEDLEKCRLTRDLLAKHCMAPWFPDYVQNAWVRYLIGQENGQPVYRICQIANLGADTVKTYRINDKQTDQALELMHGKSVKPFPMDKVSNGNFQPKEFERLAKVCSAEDVKLPTKWQLEKKIAEMNKLVSQPVTESDINAMLARKNQLNKKTTAISATMEKSRLMQARTLAQRRNDYNEVAEIDAKLAELTPSQPQKDESVDLLAKVNERNRKANMEAVRKAELAEVERKRRERKLAASGTATPVDPSARLKIKPRLFDAATPTSRPGTPAAAAATPVAKPDIRQISPLPLSVPALALNGSGKSFEASIIDSIEIDLGDF